MNRLFRTGASVLLLLTSALAAAQVTGGELDLYYRYPVGFGVGYRPLTPLRSLATDFTIVEVAGELRVPVPSAPAFQPLLRGGVLQFGSLAHDFPEKWDHRHLYAAAGAAYAHRFARNFEIGADLMAGATYAVFPSLVDIGPVGAPYLYVGGGGKITLVPSYNLAIEIQPHLSWIRSFSPLREVDGALFGLGFSVHYRFGEDPDSAGALIRSLRFGDVSVPALFAAMQSYYIRNPFGTVSLTNTERHPITDVEVSFYQHGFMDSPTGVGSIERLEPGETVEVPLFASFNGNVFTTEGVTPLVGEVIVTYRNRARPAEQRQPVSYDLYDRSAVTWDDDRKIGALITPADSALRNYASFIRQAVRDLPQATYNEPLLFAMQLYVALSELGVLYQADPTSPFVEVHGNRFLVDSVSLPRETLSRTTGDCDDLTVLFCSMLESVGLETGFITVPGHIYPAINTGVPTRAFRDVHPDRAVTIDVDGEIWVPLEITLVGRSSFLEAWARGAEQWNAHAERPELRRFYRTRAAQEIYRPVGLRETDLGLQYGRPSAIASGYARDLARVAAVVTASYADEARRSSTARNYNRLGLAHARFAQYPEAQTAFRGAVQIDPSYTLAMINLGNVRFLTGDYPGAIRYYADAHDQLAAQDRGASSLAQLVLLNLAQVHQAMDDPSAAEQHLAQAQQLGPLPTGHVPAATDETGRASGAGAGLILFAEDTDH